MNDQQKKEVLEADSFREFCDLGCSGCPLWKENRPIEVCADEFYKIKIDRLKSSYEFANKLGDARSDVLRGK